MGFYSLLFMYAAHADLEPATLEYKLKAVFMLNFAKFIEWPTKTFPSESASLNICIIGHDPFGPLLNEVIKDEMVHNHTVDVKRLQSPQNIGVCHIAFLSPSLKPNFSKLLRIFSNTQVVTISEVDGFIQQGGMINFISIDNKIRFEINPESITNAGLSVSSRLLALARIVTP